MIINKKQKHHINNLCFAFGLITTIISFFIFICSTILLLQTIVNPNFPPKIFDLTPQIIMTNDMSGNKTGHIEKGDLIIIKKVNISNINNQSVIAYLDNGKVFVSRVISIKSNGNLKISVHADNVENGFLIYDSQIIGTVTQRISGVGKLLHFSQTIIGKIVFIGIPSLILITLLIYDIISKIKRNKNKNGLKKEKTVNENQ